MRETSSVTIGITCYNAQNTIERAIQGALAQTYPNFEIVVVDDCSTDDSAQIIESYMANLPAIRFIRHAQNKGFPAALNSIVHNAEGDYIAFFDDDDESATRRLKEQLKRVENFEKAHHTDKIFCYTNRAIVLPNQDKPDHIALAIGRKAPEPRGQAVADNILWHTNDRNSVWGLFGSGTLMINTSYLKELGPFDEKFRRSAEWDMAIRGAFDGAHFIAVDKALVTQFKTPTADKSGKIPLKYALQLREKHKPYLKKRGIYLASLCIARHRFEYNQGRYMLSLFWLASACFLAPRKIGIEKLSHHIRKRLICRK